MADPIDRRSGADRRCSVPKEPIVLSPQERHRILREYLYAKYREGDWHGVSDAANDLRVLEAQYPEWAAS